MKKSKVISILTTILLIIMGAYTLFPIFLAVLNSFKSQDEIFKSVLSFPSHLNFNNYIEAFQKMDFLRTAGNTLYITALSVSGIILVGSLAGYKFF